MNGAVQADVAANGCSDSLARNARIYRQCARCGAPIEVAPILPRHSQDGALWSDGYLDAPDVSEPPILGKCRVCDAVGCLVELPVMDDVPQLALKGDYTFVPLTLTDYASLLENVEEIAEQFHLYLRIRFWQLNNHRRRGNDDPEPLSDIERANLAELIELLGEEDPDRLVKAELFRQLKEFVRAEALLAKPVAPELTPMAERLQRLLAERNAGIVKIF